MVCIINQALPPLALGSSIYCLHPYPLYAHSVNGGNNNHLRGFVMEIKYYI